MRTIIPFIAVVCLLISCNKKRGNEQPVIHDTISISEATARAMKYPVPFKEVLKAHGGIGRWNNMNNLCFEVKRKTGTEIHTTSLKDRKSLIEAENWAIGNNGNQVWLNEKEENAYKDNPRFYHNLLFYFYSMPFIVGDDGVNYSEVKGTELDGEVYEGIKISFDNNIGDSPKDEFILFYHPETYRMEWLAYTVTFKTNEKNTEWRFIKYGSWHEVNGLRLAKSITWYNVAKGKPVDARTTLNFDKVTITETLLDETMFQKPKGATMAER